MTLGEAIKTYRETHELSMRGFAKAAELSPPYISALEKNQTYRGNIPTPSYDVYKKIAKAMNIAVDDLLRMVDDDIVVRDGYEGFTEISGPKAKLYELIRDLPEDKAEMLYRIALAALER